MVEFIKEKLQECFSSLQYPLSPNFDDILEIFLCFGTQANRKCFFQCLSWWSTVGLNIFVSVSFCMLIYLSLLSLSPWFFLIRLIIAWSKDWWNIADQFLFIIRKSNSLTSTSFHCRFCVFVLVFHKGCLAILFSPGWSIGHRPRHCFY